MRRLLASFLACAACAPESAARRDGGDTGLAAGDAEPAGDSAPSCPRVAAAADRTRFIVVSHPYDASSNDSDAFAVWQLDAAGALGGPLTPFALASTFDRRVVFTPDGEVAIVAESNGTIGVVTLDAAGAPTVVHAALTGLYAESVVMAPEGDRVYAVNPNWEDSGGGIYRLDIGCDGTLTNRGRVLAARAPRELLFLGDGRAILTAQLVLDSPADADVHLLAWSDAPTRLASADAFVDPFISSSALTPDGRFVLIGSKGLFDPPYEGVAVLGIEAAALTVVQHLPDIQEPTAVVVSPFDDAAIVVGGFDDAIFGFAYDPLAATPFTGGAELVYVGGSPALPFAASLVDRGGLTGLVVVAENQGLRRVQFDPNGMISDLGRTPTGTGSTSILGAFGLQP